MYRVTHQVEPNLSLTSKQKVRPGQARPKRNFCYDVNGGLAEPDVSPCICTLKIVEYSTTQRKTYLGWVGVGFGRWEQREECNVLLRGGEFELSDCTWGALKQRKKVSRAPNRSWKVLSEAVLKLELHSGPLKTCIMDKPRPFIWFFQICTLKVMFIFSAFRSHIYQMRVDTPKMNSPFGQIKKPWLKGRALFLVQCWFDSHSALNLESFHMLMSQPCMRDVLCIGMERTKLPSERVARNPS